MFVFLVKRQFVGMVYDSVFLPKPFFPLQALLATVVNLLISVLHNILGLVQAFGYKNA